MLGQGAPRERSKAKSTSQASLGLKDNKHEGSPQASTPSMVTSQCSYPPYTSCKITFLYIKAINTYTESTTTDSIIL